MLNRAIIQGRLTRDPELRHTPAGTAVASFTVAWSELYQGQERKLYLACTAWGGNAEFVSKYFRKGSATVVEGRLGSRSWQDREGNKRETIEMTAERIHFCGPKQEMERKPEEVVDAFEEADDEDLPF